jgi:nucleotide-binding universal stress UspA family protein
MFKHLLIPTDGSRLAAKGINAGIRLAKSLRARVTGVHVSFPYSPPMYAEGLVYPAGISLKEYRTLIERQAKTSLAPLIREARKAGVACTTRNTVSAQPWRAILAAARSRRCDAIVMASHGRSALGGLILGSETTQILARSKIPVIVVR